MINQTPKLLIDVGEIGNASTGDILYDGGRKINEDFNNVYNTFGDQRLYSIDSGQNSQVLHATGYYQKATNIIEWNTPVALGSLRDVDTSKGVVTARIARGKMGEGIIFINSNGTLSPTQSLEIELQGTDTFVSAPTNKIRFTSPYTKITLWCIDDANGVGTWDYSIENMFGVKHIPLDRTYNIGLNARDIPIALRGDFKTMKLLLTAISTDETKYKASEVMLFVDTQANQVYSTEYGVLRRGHVDDDDELYTINFKIGADNFVTATVSAPVSMKLAIKVAETQTIGVAI
ncbi:baseplate tail fiber connector [Escherichia phage vB_EcoM_VR20]|uniref:Baseplate tail fiber connector n=1 Tax=Escherichia phage vB_EcoM_VR20 TaxID=1567027 RepID=A0A0A7HBY9_9CAUD|nr:baseplate wedge tail fiber protein connector [Escherichia phage vB_EcoM_VR20]AIZ02227.1 baseplate tail fiber connector [Escherichia phage vB_EcoM_VR20]